MRHRHAPTRLQTTITWLLVTLMVQPVPGAMAQVFTNPFPTVIERTINDGSSQRSSLTNLSLIFNTNVTLSASNLVLRNLTTTNRIDPTNFALAYDSSSNKATWKFPGLPGGSLPEGNYIASLLA